MLDCGNVPQHKLIRGSDKTIKAVSQNIPTILDVVEYCFTSDRTSDHSLIEDAIKLVHTLRLSSHQQLASDDDSSKQRLLNLVLAVVSRLDADEFLIVIADLATDVMGKDQGRSVAQLVASKIVQDQFTRYQKELLEGSFTEDSLVYGRLVVTTAATWIDDQPDPNSWTLPHLDEILEKLILLAGTAGYPIEDDTLIPDVLEFWSTYVEWAADLCSNDQKDKLQVEEWCLRSHNYTSRVLEVLLGKLQMPPLDQFSRWDRQSQVEFRALRRDFRDFSASAYLLLGTSMLETLVNYLPRLWAEQNWSGAEITLQCLKGVVEAVIDGNDGDPALLVFLASPAFEESTIPLGVRQACIELLADCSPFFERQKEPPMRILEWLFVCIDNQTLSLSAAKAISSICDACRGKLSSNAPALANLWNVLLAGNQQPAEVIERLAQAVGAVIQAFWTQSKHKPTRVSAIEALDSLLQSILQHIQTVGMDDTPQCKDQRMTVLQSLLNISRSFHEVEDEIVDLDGDNTNGKQADPSTESWMAVRQKDFVTTLTGLLQRYPSDGDLMEVCCLLFRAGITDNSDNPFRSDETLLICLLKGHLATTPRPQFLLETVSRWLRSSRSWTRNGTATASMQRNTVAQACLVESLQCLETVHNGKAYHFHITHTQSNIHGSSSRRPKQPRRTHIQHHRPCSLLHPTRPVAPHINPRNLLLHSSHSNQMLHSPRTHPQTSSKLILGTKLYPFPAAKKQKKN